LKIKKINNSDHILIELKFLKS